MENSKILSLSGRITLINSVLTAMPLYMVSMYKVPLQLDKTLRQFLWQELEIRKNSL